MIFEEEAKKEAVWVKSHYVSKLIIKRFSDAIGTFEIKTKKVLEKRNPENIFFRKGFYTDEVESKMGTQLESPFATLLDDKILHEKDIISLKRFELTLIKQYLLLDSIKTMGEEMFSKVIKGFSPSALRFANLNPNVKLLPTLSELNLSDHEIFDSALQVFLDCKSINEMLLHPKATLEFYCWAIPFLESFLTFWDSEEEEFILSDNGMASEYETSHHIFGGLSISKFSYIQKKMRDSKEKNDLYAAFEYARLLQSTILMFENFNIFNLSSHRCIILANPFFRLYSKNGLVFRVKDKLVELGLPNPEIWPSVIQDKKAFEVPENQYVEKTPVTFSENDIFVYHPYVLSSLDTMYINTLLLSSTHNLLGFGKLEKILNSIYLFIWTTGMNKFAEKGDPKSLVNSVLCDNLTTLINYAFEKGMKSSIDVDSFFRQIVEKQLYDVRNNFYLYDYLLSDLSRLKEEEAHFSFLGDFDQIVKIFESWRKRIQEKN